MAMAAAMTAQDEQDELQSLTQDKTVTMSARHIMCEAYSTMRDAFCRTWYKFSAEIRSDERIIEEALVKYKNPIPFMQASQVDHIHGRLELARAAVQAYPEAVGIVSKKLLAESRELQLLALEGGYRSEPMDIKMFSTADFIAEPRYAHLL